jgi:hypothetical protein
VNEIGKLIKVMAIQKLTDFLRIIQKPFKHYGKCCLGGSARAELARFTGGISELVDADIVHTELRGAALLCTGLQSHNQKRQYKDQKAAFDRLQDDWQNDWQNSGPPEN